MMVDPTTGGNTRYLTINRLQGVLNAGSGARQYQGERNGVSVAASLSANPAIIGSPFCVKCPTLHRATNVMKESLPLNSLPPAGHERRRRIRRLTAVRSVDTFRSIESARI